ncbi:type IV pilus biogenesis protein PilM [Carnobacterium gallinarum]|uniref:type IV pilus biogenesis protein PilM n=1 Tax=Carnobacterium gallinarum TaxID=2749 RepID=UPI000557A1EC|nr:hypothetical protein [Carnobacterium gallinarum]
MFGRTKTTIGIDIKKNVVRYCVLYKGQFTCGEKLANKELIKNDKLKNKQELVNILKVIFKETHITNPSVIISALNSKVLIRQIPLQEMTTEKEMREFLFFEIGESITLPFEKPVFDLLILDTIKKRSSKNQKQHKRKNGKQLIENVNHIKGKIPICITSEELLEEVGDVIQKCNGNLVGVDFSPLAYMSVLKREIDWEKNFALVEIDSGEATITIFENTVPIYVQYEDYNKSNWRYIELEDQIVPEYRGEEEALYKLGEIINNVVHYFESELSNDGTIANIYLVGGHPKLKRGVIDIIRKKNTIQVNTLTSSLEKIKVPDRFLLTLGLALKEV